MTPAPLTKSKAPRGCNAPPIALALRPEENDVLIEVADRESRSKASMARILVLEALEARRVESAKPTPVSH